MSTACISARTIAQPAPARRPGRRGGGRQRPRSRTTSVSTPPGSRASATSTDPSVPPGRRARPRSRTARPRRARGSRRRPAPRPRPPATSRIASRTTASWSARAANHSRSGAIDRRTDPRGQQRDVVAALAPPVDRAPPAAACTAPPGRARRRSRRRAREPLQPDVERLAAALDRAVGVQDQRRGLRHRRGRVHVDVPERAVQRHAARALQERAPRRRRRRSSGGGCPARRVADLARAGVDDGVDERRAARARDAVRVAREQLQHARRRAPLERVGAQRAAQLAHRRGRLRPVPDDVADRDPQPPAGQLERVVEVPARGGAVGRRAGSAPRARARPACGSDVGQQRLLQRQRQVVLGLVAPRAPERLPAQPRQREQVVAVVGRERRAGSRTRARSRRAPRRRRRAAAARPTAPAGGPRGSAGSAPKIASALSSHSGVAVRAASASGSSASSGSERKRCAGRRPCPAAWASSSERLSSSSSATHALSAPSASAPCAAAVAATSCGVSARASAAVVACRPRAARW